MKREPIYKEIAGVINALVENTTDEGTKIASTYVYNGFRGTDGWVLVVMNVKSGDLRLLCEGDEVSMSDVRTREMLWVRNSLFRDYGKRVFRKQAKGNAE